MKSFKKIILYIEIKKKKKKVSMKTHFELEKGEAATIIQKQYRGYKTRQIYGSQIKYHSPSEEYDLETEKMLRFYCNKWRARSMFQVLLLYRAARKHDLVYFSQQVHLYNQNAVSELSTTTNINLDKIKVIDKSQAVRILGIRPSHVFKLPFRFDKIPYFDTSSMCNPVEAGLDAVYSDSFLKPGDHDTWDTPLRRKKLQRKANSLPADIVTDQEIQIKEENVVRASTPTNNIYNSFVPPALKKIDNRIDFPSEKSLTEKTIDKPTLRPVSHIKELEEKGKEIGLGNTDAPFNFQAMLRKTNYTRNSLKRETKSFPEITPWQPTIPKTQESQRILSYSAVVKKIPEPVYNKRASESIQVSYNEDKIKLVTERFEIIPGFIVEGFASDL